MLMKARDVLDGGPQIGDTLRAYEREGLLEAARRHATLQEGATIELGGEPRHRGISLLPNRREDVRNRTAHRRAPHRARPLRRLPIPLSDGG